MALAEIGTRAATALLLVAAVAAGVIWSRRWHGLERGPAAVILAFAAASVSLSFVGGAASLFDASWLRPPWGPLAAAALVAVVGAGLRLARRPADPERAPSVPRPVGTESLAIALAVVAMAFAAAVTVIHPPGGYDGLAFHLPLGLAFFRHGNVAGVLDPLRHALSVGDHRPQFSLAYPGGAELVEGAIVRSLGEHAVTVYQVPFGAAVALGVARFAQELGARPWWPMAAALAAPIVLFQAGQEGTDLVVGSCLVAAFVFGVCGPVRRDRLLLSSLSLGLALAVKTIVAPLVAVLAIAILWRLSRASGERSRFLRWLAPMAVLAIAPVAVWWIRDVAAFSNPIYPLRVRLLGLTIFPGEPRSVFGLGGQAANFVPTPWAWPLYPLFEKYTGASGFGAILVVGAIPGIALAVWRRWRTGRVALVVWTALAVVSLAVAVVFPLPTPRRQLVVGLLALALAGLVVLLLPTARAAQTVLLIAMILTVAVAVDRYGPIAAAPLDRAAFYQREWYVEPSAAQLGAGALVFDDVTWSGAGYPAVYGLEGPNQDQRVVTGSLGGDSPTVACGRLPIDTTHVYAVSRVEVSPAAIARTYRSPWFRRSWTVVRDDPQGRDRRTLFVVSPSCRALARR